MKRILVGVDGSEPSNKAATMAAEIAARFGAQVTLAYAVVPLVLPTTAYALSMADVNAEHERYAAGLLEKLASKLPMKRDAIETRILSGPPAESLADFAEEWNADLVAIGSRGLGAVARVVLGSTSDRLLRISTKPVLVFH